MSRSMMARKACHDIAMIRTPAAPLGACSRFSDTLLAMMLVMLTPPHVAAAQDARPLEVSGGYSFVHDPNNHISLAAGWMAGGGVALTDWLAAVVDAGGSYKTISSFGSEVHVTVHTAMAGVRASAGVGKVTEFGQVLVGFVRGSGTAFGFASTSHA